MRRRLISVFLAITILFNCFTTGVVCMSASARDAGVGTGAESCYPIDFSLSEEITIGSEIDIALKVAVLDSRYNARINFISAYAPYYTEGGISYFNIEYSIGTIVSDEASFAVTGRINAEANSVVRYTITYDVLDDAGNVVWKNLTGYTYGFVSGSDSHTGPVGTYHQYPGQLSDGCYFEVLDTLNTTYVQQSELMLSYKIRTQTGLVWNYSDARTRGVNVISGNPPSTLDTMPDNNNAQREGQMDWPKSDAIYRSAGGRWLAITEPPSGYYNFTISFNSWNDDWEDQSNITETTEMYYITNADRVSSLNAANKIMKVKNTFADGYYVQKGLYTEESWNKLINALDIAYQVAFSVANANYGYKVACLNASTAAAAVEEAFANLEKAEHDFYTYKDQVITEPTCTEPGTRLLTCLCGEEKTEEIPANGHVQGDWKLIKSPTCTEEGLEELRCTVCNEVVKEKVLAVIAHSYIRTVISPTCVDRGYMVSKCFVCGDSYTSNYVDPLGHNYQSEVIAPTCEKKGCTVHICYVCSDSYTDEYTDIIPHDYIAQVTEPTCTETGFTTYTCSACSDQYIDDYTDVIPHDYIAQVTEPTCTETGFTTYTCSACSDQYIDDYTDVIPHDYIAQVTEPTCTEKGFTTYTCNVCSDEYIDDYVDATGHDIKATVIEPTKTENGCTYYQCRNCEYNYTGDYVPALGEGVSVSGAVKSFATNADDSETVETTIELIKVGEEEVSYTVSVAGTGLQNYSIEGVSEGNYILRVSKTNHATREYEITVASEDVTQELVIHLMGDINGDGKVNTVDTARVNSHAKSVGALGTYEQACADINSDNKINTVDVARINSHAKGVIFLW